MKPTVAASTKSGFNGSLFVLVAVLVSLLIAAVGGVVGNFVKLTNRIDQLEDRLAVRIVSTSGVHYHGSQQPIETVVEQLAAEAGLRYEPEQPAKLRVLTPEEKKVQSQIDTWTAYTTYSGNIRTWMCSDSNGLWYTAEEKVAGKNPCTR